MADFWVFLFGVMPDMIGSYTLQLVLTLTYVCVQSGASLAIATDCIAISLSTERPDETPESFLSVTIQ